MFRQLFVVVAHCASISTMVILSSCASTYSSYDQYKPDTKTGYYDTPIKLGADAIVTKSKIDLTSYGKIAMLVVPNDGVDPEVIKLMKQFVLDLSISAEVRDKKEMESYVIANSLESKVTTLDSPIGLKQLANVVGPYLVFQYKFTRPYNSVFIRANLSIIDAATNTVVFEVEYLANDFNGVTNIARGLLAPGFNETVTWVKECRTPVGSDPIPEAPARPSPSGRE